MKYLLSFIALSLMLFAKDVDTAQFKKLSMFENPAVTIERAYDHGSLYQVIFTSMTPEGPRRFSSFITKDKKAFIMGEAYDIQNQKALKIPLDIAQIKKDADFVYGTGKQEFIIVTDPECRYCQMFQQQWEKIKGKYTLYVFLYPLGNHAQAEQMSYYVMEQKTDAAKASALIGISNGETKYTSLDANDAVREKHNKKFGINAALAEQLGVRGTPAVYDFQGNFVNWKQLTQ